MIKFAVCIKAVRTNLVYENEYRSESYVINPYDLYALKELTSLKKKYDIEITCICMAVPWEQRQAADAPRVLGVSGCSKTSPLSSKLPNKAEQSLSKKLIYPYLRECPAYTLLYQFSPKDTGQSKVK